jgi:hypothetical protein
MTTSGQSDPKTQRQLRRAVRKILATVKQVAALGDEARKAQAEFERLTNRESEGGRG